MTDPRPGAPLLAAFFHLLDITVVAGLAVMVVLVFGNVVLRYGFNSGIDISEELSRIIFVWVIFLGTVIGFRERAHLGVDTITRHLPRAGRIACHVLSASVMLAICVLVFHGSYRQAVINLHNPAPVTGIPLAVGYGVSMFMTASIALMIMGSLRRALSGRLTDEELSQVRESEEERALPASADRPAVAIDREGQST